MKFLKSLLLILIVCLAAWGAKVGYDLYDRHQQNAKVTTDYQRRTESMRGPLHNPQGYDRAAEYKRQARTKNTNQ